MRIIKLFISIAAVLALLALPIAAQAGGHHRARATAVVRSFKSGVLSIRTPRGTIKSADVTDGTDLTCQASSRARKRVKRVRRRGGRARAAVDVNGDTGDDTGDDPGGDTSNEDGSDDLGNDGSDDAGDNSGDDFVQDDNEVDDSPDPAEPHARKRGAGRTCTSAALRRGVRVKAAKLDSGSGEWTKLVLVRR